VPSAVKRVAPCASTSSGASQVHRQCSDGNEADWDCTVSILAWVKLIAIATAITIAMDAVVVGAAWLAAHY
jgi:hypothetical protein